MSLTNSTMLPLGTILPPFELDEVSGTISTMSQDSDQIKKINSSSFTSKPLALMIICAHCPFVKHLEIGISNLDKDYSKKINILAICSNSVLTHPEDAPEFLAQQAQKFGWSFPYLLDSDQKLAKDLKAACTPDFFLFFPSSSGEQRLAYRGQFDDSRPGNGLPVTGKSFRKAFDDLLQGRNVSKEQKPSIGCNIKWHPGKEPSWFA